MSKVVSVFLSPTAENGGGAVELDGTPLLFAPMAEIRCAVQEHMHDPAICRVYAQVFRGAARTLVDGMIAPGGTRWARCGLPVHHAGRRAVELLDFAAELDVGPHPCARDGE